MKLHQLPWGCLAIPFVLTTAMAAAPSVSDFDNAKPEGRRAVIASWASAIEKQRSEGKLVPADWSAFKARLSKIDAPELFFDTAYFFSALKENCPENVTFSHTVLKSSDAVAVSAAAIVLDTLQKTGVHDDETLKLLLDLVPKSAARSAIFQVLSKNYSDRAEIRNAANQWLQGNDPTLKADASRFLTQMPSNAPNATFSMEKMIDQLKDNPSPETVRNCGMFFASLSNGGGAFAFRHSLDKSRMEDVFKLMESKDPQIAFMGCYIFLLGAREFTSQTTDRFISSLDAQNGQKSILLGAVGFMPVAKTNDPAKLESIFEKIRSHQDAACSGLISAYIRAGGNIGQLAQYLAKPAKGAPNVTYWLALDGRSQVRAIPPAEWKKLWEEYKPTEKEPERRYTVVQQIEAFPQAPEVSWLIEQAIADPRFRARDQYLLDSIWRIRRYGKSLANVQGFKDWLQTKVNSADSLENSIVAATMMYYVYGSREIALSQIEKSRDALRLLAKWTRITDAIIEIDPSNPILEGHRQSLMFDSKNANRPVAGGEWLAWLMDLKRGRKVGEPPLESMVLAFGMNAPPPAWIASASELEDRIAPWVEKFRDPFVFAVGSSVNFDATMKWLGVLDRLERNRRE